MSEYNNNRESILTEYYNKAKGLISKKDGNGFADVVPFFKDGVVDEETWFAADNDFRPLFIMKEPSTGISGENANDIIEQLKEYIKVWGICYDHTCEEYGDIRIGVFPTWMRIAKLAKALEIEITSSSEFTDCSSKEFEFCFQKGECNPKKDLLDKIEAYLEKLNKENIGKRKEKNKYKYKTANGNYTNIINKIAVINIKKLGSGKYCNTKLSEMGCTFEEYLKNTDICEILHRQIEIIDPTVIIVCGKGMWDSVNKAIKLSDLSYSKDGHKVICIESYHPSYVKSDIDHCKYIIENYRAAIK